MLEAFNKSDPEADEFEKEESIAVNEVPKQPCSGEVQACLKIRLIIELLPFLIKIINYIVHIW